MKGIYKCGNTYAYSINLEKKLKRKKNAEIIEVCDDSLDENGLQLCLNNYLLNNKIQEEFEDVVLHHFKNTVTNETLISIYPDLHNIPNINKEEWKKF